MSLLSWEKPTGQVTNSYLELSCIIIHHACMADFDDVQERTTLFWTDNTAGLWWQRKGSTTSNYPFAHLLLLQVMHQRFHRYIPTTTL